MNEYLNVETATKLARLEQLEKYLEMVLLTAQCNDSVKVDIAYIENMKQILDGTFEPSKRRTR